MSSYIEFEYHFSGAKAFLISLAVRTDTAARIY